MFFASGPVEAAFSNKAAGFIPDADKQRMFGYGSYDLAIDAFESAVRGKEFVAGGRFSAADVYVGSMLAFMMGFKLMEPRPVFSEYVERLEARPAWKRAKEIDDALIPQPQPA
jgi:glutathione S-transferase